MDRAFFKKNLTIFTRVSLVDATYERVHASTRGTIMLHSVK
jgi:hypothetical protein